MATVRELLQEHNDIGFGVIKSWSKPKAELEALVASLRRGKLEARGQVVTIGSVAEQALLEVAGEDDNGNRLGHPYDEVLARVLHLFPEAQTTPRCLAWYASKMRGAGMRVPYRPRARRSK